MLFVIDSASWGRYDDSRKVLVDDLDTYEV